MSVRRRCQCPGASCGGALGLVRTPAFQQLARSRPVEPSVPYPEEIESYGTNVHDHRGADVNAWHDVTVVAAAHECHEDLGDISQSPCTARRSPSLCPSRGR